MKRTPLKRVSLKRAASFAARRECVRAVIARDKVCVFPARNAAWLAEFGIPVSPNIIECSGPFEVHEPAKRSHGADPTNPDDCVLTCAAHHRFLHDYPLVGEALGLLTKTWRSEVAR